jgi:hypothetical protein
MALVASLERPGSVTGEAKGVSALGVRRDVRKSLAPFATLTF